MKVLSKQQALEQLLDLKSEFRNEIAERYEHRAKSCLTCETPGACCTDTHFVNVHVSPLEAAAIRRELERLPEALSRKVYERAEIAIDQYGLSSETGATGQTYACPLFEKGIGCLVHATAKPAPCIHHACYENESDLPPNKLLDRQETAIDKLNRRVYGRRQNWLPIPLAINQKK